MRDWPNFIYCPGIRLEGLNKTTEIRVEYSLPEERNLNLKLPECEARVLTLSARTFTAYLMKTANYAISPAPVTSALLG
jgi:hypothetical protein